MNQNRSSAVMAQRAASAPGELDYYPTPPFATRAMCEFIDLSRSIVWEPACGENYMADPLREYAAHVIASDVFDYGVGSKVIDFLSVGGDDAQLFQTRAFDCDWVITNPPFKLFSEFLDRALKVSKVGVAFFIRLQILEGAERYAKYYRDGLLTQVHQFTERVALVKGRFDPSAESATAYCWLEFRHGAEPRPIHWIAPCRDRLERPDDFRGES